MTRDGRRRIQGLFRAGAPAKTGRGYLWLWAWAAGLLPFVPPAVGQPADSLRSYDLAEIVIADGPEARRRAFTVQRITLADLARFNPVSISDFAPAIPGAHAQTNSRGETLIYLRNAGERQVGVFFDGALLNVPWDQRVDLGLVPSGMVGGVTVAKGVPPVLFGTNVLGGAVSMTSREAPAQGTTADVSFAAGSHAIRELTFSGLGRLGRFSYAAHVGRIEREAIALPAETGLPFGQEDGDVRTNTDRDLSTVFARIGYDFAGGGAIGVSTLRASGTKGVAPEGHIDPTRGGVRYWRYPDYLNQLVILNARAGRAGRSGRLAAWWNGFSQTIDQFEGPQYAVVQERQNDNDHTLGVRLTTDVQHGEWDVRSALSVYGSRHDQTDVTLSSPAQPGVSARYTQRVLSVGTELERDLGVWIGTVGLSLDGVATPRTGDKPDRDPQWSWGGAVGARRALTERLDLRMGVGRKVRFPTPRELFGTALDRFLLNPELKPESSVAADVAFVYAGRRISGEVVPFVQRTFDTIDQRRIEVEGQALRQRVNLQGSFVAGLEIAGSARSGRYVRTGLNATATYARALTALGRTYLTEKPAWLVSASGQFSHPRGFSVLVQPVYRGVARGLSEENDFVRLRPALVWNLRMGYLMYRSREPRVYVDLFVRGDNLFDRASFPQLGLPEAGRTIRVGLTLGV